MVAIAENSLRILAIEHRTGEHFTQQVLKTRHTPCKLLSHPESNNLIVLEKDHRAFSMTELDEMTSESNEQKGEKKNKDIDWSKLGSYPKAVKDQFASCVRIVDPFNMETL